MQPLEASKSKFEHLKRKPKIAMKKAAPKRKSKKVITGHPGLDLVKKTKQTRTKTDGVREHSLPESRLVMSGKKAVQWAKGNRLVSIPFSILAGVVTTAIVKIVLSAKSFRTE